MQLNRTVTAILTRLLNIPITFYTGSFPANISLAPGRKDAGRVHA